MKKHLLHLPAIAALLALPTHAATMEHVATTKVSDNASAVNISVFPAKAGYDDAGLDGDPSSGVFGDGTVSDYRFFDSPDEAINSYADGGGGLVGMATSAPGNINGAGESWANVWTTNDPGSNFDNPPPNIADTVITFARSANITGSIDISSLTDGTLYFIHGTFINAWNIALVMSSPGQPDVEANIGEGNGPGTNFAWITEFNFGDAAAYNTITYTYTNTDADGSRARFMGVIIDGSAEFGPEDTDGDFLLDLWEDEHFGDNNGSVEPSDLTVTDGTADADLDGATDRQEHDFGSDPNVADTDGDGLDDGPEINTHGSDPIVADTDGDGLDDGPEVNTHGTSPTVADTDGDGLDDGEELSLGEDGFITNPLKLDSDDDGVNDDQDTAPNDPGNDNDGDGLSNEDETNTHGTDPLVADTDGDGIDDGEEVIPGLDGFVTLPLNADTDGDAIMDGLEISLATDPTDRNSIPTSGPAGLAVGTTVQVSNNHTDFNLSVFPGKAGYDDGGLDGNANSGTFGDGTVLDYRFFHSPDNVLTSYADGEAGIVGDATATNSNGGGEHWAVVWTTNDPGADFAGGDAPNFPAPTLTFARSQGVVGSIDISGLASGSLHFPHGTFINAWNIELVMSGPGQEDVTVNAGAPNGPGTNLAWITSFAFFNAGLYDTITYTYTNTDIDASRARFMGVIVDGAASDQLALRITDITYARTTAPDNIVVSLTFTSQEGRSYTVFRSNDFALPVDSRNDVDDSVTAAVGETATTFLIDFNDRGIPLDDEQFFVVRENL